MSLWHVTKPASESHAFGDISPIDVLAEFDEPLIFTFRNKDGSLMLAYLCAIGVGITRYLASLTTARIVRELKNGMKSIREAMLYEKLWIIDVDASTKVVAAWQVSIDDLPNGALPENDVLLTPELEAAIASDQKLAVFARKRKWYICLILLAIQLYMTIHLIGESQPYYGAFFAWCAGVNTWMFFCNTERFNENPSPCKH